MTIENTANTSAPAAPAPNAKGATPADIKASGIAASLLAAPDVAPGEKGGPAMLPDGALTETPAETPDAPEPTTPAELSRLERVKQTAARARASAEKNAQMMRERQAAETRAADVSRQLAESQRVAEQNADLQRRLRDPQTRMAALREAGFSAEDIAREAIAAQDPNAAVKQALERVAALEADIKAREQRAQQEQQFKSVEAATRAAQQAVVTLASDEAVYPHVSQVPPAMLLTAAQALIAGMTPAQRQAATNKDIVDYLEWDYARHVATRAAKRGTPPSNEPGEASKGPKSKKTLTNGQASAKISGKTPYDKLSAAEKKAADVALIEGLMRGEKK